MKLIIIIICTILILTSGAFVAFRFLYNCTSIKNQTPILFNERSFDFEFLRTLEGTAYQTADIGECFEAARHIKDGDFESWYSAWNTLAQRIQAVADDALAKGHKQSAREAYARATNYHRTAEFYLHGNKKDPRILDSTRKSRDCFLKVISLADGKIESVKINYENTTLPGYFYYAQINDNKPRKTVIIQTGFDGTQEELYGHAMAACSRGYNVLTFEGPGQGQVIREQGLPFRADWEAVIKPVVDYAISRQEVDPNKLALYGFSLGGYLAPRGASVDHRIKALIANGGIYDVIEGIIASNRFLPQTKEKMIEYLQHQSEAFDKKAYSIMKNNTEKRWAIENGMFTFQVDTPHEYMLKYSELTMKNHAHLIQCPTLVCDSENEMDALRGQSKALFDHLTCPKTFMLFKASEGAGDHCQIGATLLSNQRVFDWLDETFAK